MKLSLDNLQETERALRAKVEEANKNGQYGAEAQGQRVALEAVQKQIAALQKKQSRVDARTMETKDGATVKIGDTVFQARVRSFNRGWAAEPDRTQHDGRTYLEAYCEKPLDLTALPVRRISPDRKSFDTSSYRSRASYDRIASDFYSTKEAAIVAAIRHAEREIAFEKRILAGNEAVLIAALEQSNDVLLRAGYFDEEPAQETEAVQV